jgi:hypothetical protein
MRDATKADVIEQVMDGWRVAGKTGQHLPPNNRKVELRKPDPDRDGLLMRELVVSGEEYEQLVEEDFGR